MALYTANDSSASQPVTLCHPITILSSHLKEAMKNRTVKLLDDREEGSQRL